MIPKIHECLDNEILRPAMCHALLTKEDFVASDAHILVVHETGELFSPEVVESIPKDGLLIPRECLVDMAKVSALGIEIIKNPDTIKVLHQTKGQGDFSRFHEYKINGGQINGMNAVYPNYKAVLPDEKEVAPIKAIGLKPALLEKLCKAMGASNLAISFISPDRPILCRPLNGDYFNVKGIIMPVMITD